MSKYRFGFDFMPESVSYGEGGGDSGGSGSGSGSGTQTATVSGYVDQVTDKDGLLYDIHDTGARGDISTIQTDVTELKKGTKLIITDPDFPNGFPAQDVKYASPSNGFPAYKAGITVVPGTLSGGKFINTKLITSQVRDHNDTTVTKLTIPEELEDGSTVVSGDEATLTLKAPVANNLGWYKLTTSFTPALDTGTAGDWHTQMLDFASVFVSNNKRGYIVKLNYTNTGVNYNMRIPANVVFTDGNTRKAGEVTFEFSFPNLPSVVYHVVDKFTIGTAADGSGDTHTFTMEQIGGGSSGPNTYVIEYNRTQTNHSVVSINGKTSTSDKITELRNLIADCTSTTQPIVCINYLDTSSSASNTIRVRASANVSPITANDVGFEFITTVFPSSGADVPSSAKYNQIRLTISGSNISDYFSSKTVSLS